MSLVFALDSLQGRKLSDRYEILLEARRRKYIEQTYFRLYLRDLVGSRQLGPFVEGIHSSGRRDHNVSGWLDVDYLERATFTSQPSLNLRSEGLDRILFRFLGSLIPGGGSFAVGYTMFHGESEIHLDTRRGLDLQFPPVVTPIGHLLFQAGCAHWFKDWYIAEGGNEGPEKLQGFKARTSEEAGKRELEMVGELEAFLALARSRRDELHTSAAARSMDILNHIKTG